MSDSYSDKMYFQDGEMIKEAFVEALFRDFKNKPQKLSSIKALQLSRRTVTQCCEVMVEESLVAHFKFRAKLFVLLE